VREHAARSLDLDGRTVQYELRRSDRARWVRADIAVHRGLRVTLPAHEPDSRAEAFLRSRRRWLFKALKRFERLATIIPNRRLEHGVRVPYLGSELTVDLAIGPVRVGRLADSLIVTVPRRTEAAVRRALREWYMDEARRDLPARAKAVADRHGLRFRKIVIGDQKTRWGTCYGNGTISFNWRLMLAPDAIATYLVCHELAHLVHPNHSKAYWAKVEELCPGYREAEQWLRKYGLSLVL
jgi:hypothetical protein